MVHALVHGDVSFIVDDGLGHRGAEARFEKIEVAAFVGLQDMAREHPAVAAFVPRRRRRPGGFAAREFFIAHVEVDRARRHIDADRVAALHQRQRAADRRLRRAVQQAAAVAGAAHARVRQTQHVFHAELEQLGRDRQHAPLGHAGAFGAGVAQDEDVVAGDVEVRVIDGALQRRVVVEDERAAGVLEQVRRAGAGLDDDAVGGEVAAQHGQRALGVDRVRQRPDHVVVEDLGAGDVVADGLAVDGARAGLQMAFDALQQRRQSAGVEEVFHQVAVAARPDVGDHRHLAAGGIEVVQRHRVAGAATHRDQVNDGVGRAAHRHRTGDAVVEVGARQQLGWRQVFLDHGDDATAAFGAHADVVGVGRRNRGGAGQRQADGFGDAHHRRRGAHRHARAMAARDAGFHFEPRVVGQAAGSALVPILEGVAARAQHLAAPVAAQHWPGGQVDERQAHRQRAHREAGRGLVAAAHQHRTIDRVRAQQLFGFHGEEVAIEHRRRLDQ